jgi:hypothetical protein
MFDVCPIQPETNDGPQIPSQQLYHNFQMVPETWRLIPYVIIVNKCG